MTSGPVVITLRSNSLLKFYESADNSTNMQIA